MPFERFKSCKRIRSWLIRELTIQKDLQRGTWLLEFTQCGNLRIFLPFRFYVKSILLIWKRQHEETKLSKQQFLIHFAKKSKNDFTKNLNSRKFRKYPRCVLWISMAFNSFFHLGRPHSCWDFLHISNLYALCAFCSTNTRCPIQIGYKLKTYVPLLDTLYDFGCS